MTLEIYGFDIWYSGVIMVPAQIGEFSKNL